MTILWTKQFLHIFQGRDPGAIGTGLRRWNKF